MLAERCSKFSVNESQEMLIDKSLRSMHVGQNLGSANVPSERQGSFGGGAYIL